MEKNATKRTNFLMHIQAKGLNARTLAKRLEVPHDRVYKWIYGKATPNPSTMLKLSGILEISEREILEAFVD